MKGMVFGALLVTAVPSIVVAQAASPSADHSIQTALGFELAKTIAPEKMGLAMARRTLGEALASNSELAELEKEWPGITEFVQRRMERHAEKEVRENLAAGWARKAIFFKDNLTDAQLRELVALYRSPLGQKAVAFASRQTAMPLVKEVVTTEGRPVSASQMKKLMVDSSDRGFAEAMTKTDIAALAKFARSPAGRRWMEIQPQLYALEAAMMNEGMADQIKIKRTQSVMITAVQDFVAGQAE